MAGPTITPHNLSLYTAQITDIYVALEDELFALIASRLLAPEDKGFDYVLQWRIKKMQELNIFNRETIEALSKTTGIATKSIEMMFNEVGFGIIDSIDTQLANLTGNTVPPPTNLGILLTSYVNQTFREIDNFVNQTLITTNYGEGTAARMYRKVVEETTAQVLAGNMTINKAMAQTVIKWQEKGIESSFVDKGGNTWRLERYADTVLRSTVNRTYNDLRLSRMKDYGVDLVRVSSHSAARPACARIQGQVASMSKPSSNPRYPSIYDFGYGEPSGTRGINCSHILTPFVEGVNENNEQQVEVEKADERYKLTQKQRYYERQIRDAKRSLKLAEQIGDDDTIARYKKLVRDRQAKVREFIEDNKLNRRYDKEQIIT